MTNRGPRSLTHPHVTNSGWNARALPPPEEYDPGQHTVADVLAYLEEHPDQRQAVLDAEEAGKARTTLLSALRVESV